MEVKKLGVVVLAMKRWIKGCAVSSGEGRGGVWERWLDGCIR